MNLSLTDYFSSSRTTGWLVFIISLVLRLVAVLSLGQTNHPQLWEFGSIANHIILGLGYSQTYQLYGDLADPGDISGFTVPSAYMPPGYLLFIAAFLSVLGETPFSYMIILIVQSIIGAFSVFLIYQISLKLFQDEVALFAGILAAIYPPFLYATTDYGTTIVYLMVLGVLWLYMLSIVDKLTISRSVVAGLVAGILSLVRADGIVVSTGLSCWLAYRGYYKYSVILFTAMIIGISPWILRNYIVFDTFVPMTTSFGLNFWRGHNLNASGTGRDEAGIGIWSSDVIDQKLKELPRTSGYEVDRDRVYLGEAFSFLRNYPAKEVMLVLRKIFFFWILDITHPKARSYVYIVSWGSILFLFIIGVRWAVQNHHDMSFLATYYLTMTLIVVMFFVLPRYQIILSYGVIPLSAFGFLRFSHWLRMIISQHTPE